MASRRPKVRRPAGAYRWRDENLSTEVGKLLQRAPQFKSLTSEPADSEDGVTESQQKFIDDFAAEIRKGAGSADDAS